MRERTPVVVADVRRRQVAWILRTSLHGGIPALRASITNHESWEEDVEALVEGVHDAIERFSSEA